MHVSIYLPICLSVYLFNIYYVPDTAIITLYILALLVSQQSYEVDSVISHYIDENTEA